MNTKEATIPGFNFTTIAGMKSIDDARRDLVLVAEEIRAANLRPTPTMTKEMIKAKFEVKKQNLQSLVDLLDQYLDQIPE